MTAPHTPNHDRKHGDDGEQHGRQPQHPDHIGHTAQRPSRAGRSRHDTISVHEMMMVMRSRQDAVSVMRDLHGSFSHRRKERAAGRPACGTPPERSSGKQKEPCELAQQAGRATQTSSETSMSQGVAPHNSDVYNYVLAELRTRKQPYDDRTRHPAKTPQPHIT
jgi:hypothetical protein